MTKKFNANTPTQDIANIAEFIGTKDHNAHSILKVIKQKQIICAISTTLFFFCNFLTSSKMVLYLTCSYPLFVFLATMVSRLSTSTWIDPYIVYKNIFKENVFEYFIKYIKYLVIILVCFIPCYYLSKLINVANIGWFIIKGVMLVLVSMAMFLLLTFKTSEFFGLKGRILTFISSKKLKRS